ncbi:MAG: four helix bundle protein [Bacteroidota bacterium]
MRDFKKLMVWERSHKFALLIYRLTKQFPKEELYGITSQIRRAATSIPTNIAEGSGKNTSKDFSRYLSIASGSASEVEYLLILVKELEFISEKDFQPLDTEINEIKKMLNSFQIKISANS